MSENLTDEEAEAMLRQLSKHYRQPVMPVKRFCRAIRTWATQIEKINRAAPDGRYRHGKAYARYLTGILIDIRKSNLLWRLLYCGEELRERPCPKHKGRWSGIGRCEHGCGMTGWLPNEAPAIPQGEEGRGE